LPTLFVKEGVKTTMTKAEKSKLNTVTQTDPVLPPETETETETETELNPNESEGNQPEKAPAPSILSIVEMLSVAGSVGGTIATILTQQFTYVGVPLSVSLVLNLINRKQLVASAEQKQREAVAQLQLHLEEEANTNSLFFKQFDSQVTELEQVVNQKNKVLKNSTDNLNQSQTKLLEMVNTLRELQLWTGLVRVNPDSGDAYYNRGLVYQRLNNREAAIVDYTKAIECHLNDPNVYQNRGLLRAVVGDKQGAVADLRQASKLFFDQGDMNNYQQTKDQAKQVHDGNKSTNSRDSNSDVSMGSLFS
jgi:hypothetical protein